MFSLNRRRRALLRLIPAAMVAAVVVAGTAVTASAHGNTIDPASRNYGCWKRWGNDFQNPAMATQDPMCYQAWQADTMAMWGWNGLYQEGVNEQYTTAVPDGTLCSGGNTGGTRYSALDVPGNWVAQNISSSSNFNVTVHDQARHGAKYFRLYVSKQGFDPLTQRLKWSDLTLLKDTGYIAPGSGQTTSDPVLNGVSNTFALSAPGLTGRHIVFVLWLAGHSDQSYYWCSDVNFGGSGGGGSTTTTTTTTRPTTTTPAEHHDQHDHDPAEHHQHDHHPAEHHHDHHHPAGRAPRPAGTAAVGRQELLRGLQAVQLVGRRASRARSR